MTFIASHKRRIFFVALLLVAVCGCAGLILHHGLPQVDGAIHGLPVREPVEIVRDSYGIPHIFARNDRDAMTAMGYVHAQDRLWQMEMFRRMAAGRLAEVAGPELLETDHWARLVNLPKMRTELVATMGEEQKALARAYLAGINAYIEQNKRDLPLEFRQLGLVPEPWTLEDIFSVPVVNSWLLETDFLQEWISLAGRAHLDREALKDALPSYPNARLPEDAYFDKLRGRKLGKLYPAMDAIYSALPSAPGQGSNNWVVAHSADGKPLLENDPHLALMVPGVWYFCHLATPEYQVAGASMPGVPGIVLGHNSHIAWAWTNVMTDIVDLFVVRLDPQHRGRYIVGDRSIEFQKEQQVYRLPGGKTQTRTIYRTIYGPVITDLSDDCDAVVALKWYGSGPMSAIGDQSGTGLLEF